MVRTVGKTIALVAIMTGTVAAEMTLRVLDTDRTPLKQAGAGHPFILDVMVTDVSSMGQMPTIEGIEQYPVKNSGVRISSINGKTTANYSFELRIDTPGSYTIGPAKVIDRGREVRSDTVTVVVGQQQIEKNQSESSKKNDAPVMLRLMVDKSDVFVGQQIECRLRFYYASPNLSIRQFIEQESSAFRRSAAQDPSNGSERVNGIDYEYVEWMWHCYPTQSGDVTISAFGVDYERPVARDDFWAGFGRLFGSQRELKRIYSNAVSLRVKPLPAGVPAHTAVGSFTMCNLSAAPSVAHQGEGMVVSLDIIGQADPELVTLEGLKGLPDALKSYESKRTVTPRGGKENLIHIEYIVQGLQPGSWQIPAQSFSYFDIYKRALTTISSTPLSVRILPALQQSAAPTATSHQEFLPLSIDTAEAAARSPQLPWPLFGLLVLMPLIITLFSYVVRLGKRVRGTKKVRHKPGAAYAIARKKIAKAQSYNDLYIAFIGCFADRWALSPAAVTQALIEQRLRAAGMSEQEYREWNLFFNDLIERAFSGSSVGDNHLFTQAVVWIGRLEKLV